ncbi:MAG: peptide ABC transporter substrate-binding protein [Rhodospirillales bacterium]|nr:peptide ABC transporter substrate-binding protein [Rhodospirillales bacterium]
MKSFAKFLAAFFIAAIPLFLGKADAGERESLTIGITQFPSTFHPNIDSMLAKSYILGMTRRPFTMHDAKWKLGCMLCETLPSLDNGLAKLEKTPGGKDGIAVTYKIQSRAIWGDGTPVTSRDAVFTWKVGRHPKSGVSGLEFYRRVYKIVAVDAKTFTLHYDKVFFDYNSINGFDILPRHLDEKIFDENPSEYKNRTAYVTDTANKGLYFGPYLITKVQPGAHVVLEPNPTWWGKKPGFKRIIVRVIANTAALEANLLSGSIDMISGDLGITIDQALAFDKRHGDKFNIIYKTGLIFEHIDLNLDNPILKDRRVRRALIHAIDRSAISKQLFGGRQPVAHTNINPLDWIHSSTIPTYAFDPKKAAALLDAAGWKAGKNGIRTNAKGEKLSLEIMTTAGNRTRELVEQVLQSQWKQAGIDARIRNQPARVFFGDTVTHRKFKSMAMFAWISAPESVPRSTLHSNHIPSQANNWGGQNYTGFNNPEMDQLIEKIEVELDRQKRASLWRRFQEIYAEELPVIPLYFRANAYILPKWLTGITPTGHLGTTSLWIENWRAEN